MKIAKKLVQDGPKIDWTMDNKICDRYLVWKYNVELIFSSAEVCIPKTMDGSNPEEASSKGRNKNPTGLSNGYIIQTFWDILEEELKPKGNKLISILELLSNRSKQGSKSLDLHLQMCIKYS